MEAAECIIENNQTAQAELTLVDTPDKHTIDDVCEFLHLPVENSCKAVVYQRNEDDSYVVVFLRGDLEANETKITNYLGGAIHPAVITPECGLAAGSIGPYNLKGDYTVLYDKSLEGIDNLCCGGNVDGKHYTGLDIKRDMPEAEYGDFAKAIDGGICPCCGKKSLRIERGIEVGNIFQLGTKYTKTMGMEYLDSEGEKYHPIMGCYGIGVGRLAASVCEVSRDEYGPIWPISIAPWEVHLCCVRADDEECKRFADKLYEELQKKRIDVIYDDRNVRAGAMFSDADLLGVPVRVVVSPRNMKNGCVEITTRDKSVSRQAELAHATEAVQELIEELYAKINESAEAFR